MGKIKKATSAHSKVRTGSVKTTTAKKGKRISKAPKENETKIHPEQYEEFINEIPDEEKTDEANEVKSNETDQNENKQ